MKTNRILTLICASLLSLSLSSYVEARGEHGGGGGKGGGHEGRPHDGKPDRPDREKPDRDADRPGDKDPGVNRRQENQDDRIKQGIRSGELTKEEAKELGKEEKEIRKEEKEYKSDGTLTKEERKDLHQDLNEASKDIYQEKHDDDEVCRKAEKNHPELGEFIHRKQAEGLKGKELADAIHAEQVRRGIKDNDPGVNNRQENQQDRLKEGVKSGELTAREAARLKLREAKLAEFEKRLKEDGSLTPEERAKLQKKLEALSEDIYKQKHDAQDRPKAD